MSTQKSKIADDLHDYFNEFYDVIKMVIKAKNPFNPYRSVMKAAIALVHPDAYRLFFPFSYIFGLIKDIIHPGEDDTRANAWYRFWTSCLGEILMMLIFSLVFALIAIAFIKLGQKLDFLPIV